MYILKGTVLESEFGPARLENAVFRVDLLPV